MSDNSANTITVLIADDEEFARALIRSLLQPAMDITIIGEAEDGFETQELIPLLKPRILLLDYRMPGPGAYNIEKWVRENHPETSTLILTAYERDAYLSEMMDSGIAGYLFKNGDSNQLIEAIRRAVNGTVYFSNEQIERAQNWKRTVGMNWENLSRREREVLEQLAAGKDNKGIANRLSISLKTTEFHITNILKKLELNSRNEAIVWMLKHQPDDPWLAKN
ncbi:MAG: response regulator transcription factor [Anaerolineales bacterium]|nr:MAG: response regulator transcription factor [Anaerolineales bacterium]